MPKRFPTDSWTRHKNRLGPLAVPCILSNRWLQFHRGIEQVGKFGECVWIDVMTDNGTEDGRPNPRKLGGLLISKDDLFRALAALASSDK